MGQMDVGELFAELWERLGFRPSKRAEVRIATAQRLFTNAGYTGKIADPIVLMLIALTDEVPEQKDEPSPWEAIKKGQWVKKNTPLGGLRRAVFHGISPSPIHKGKYGIVFIEGDDTDVAHWHIDDITLMEQPALPVANVELNDASADAEVARQEAEEKMSEPVEETVEEKAIESAEKPVEEKTPEPVELEGDRDELGRQRNRWLPIHADVPIFSRVSWDDPETGENRKGFLRRIEGEALIVGEKRRGTVNIRVNMLDALYEDVPVTEED